MTDLKDLQPGDVLMIGANGKETRHPVKSVTPHEVTTDDPFCGWYYLPTNEGGILDSLLKVGALRIVRPDPPFSVDQIVNMQDDASGVLEPDLYIQFHGNKWAKFADRTLRVRIDEVRP